MVEFNPSSKKVKPAVVLMQLQLPPELHSRIKQAAKDHSVTMREFTMQAITYALDNLAAPTHHKKTS